MCSSSPNSNIGIAKSLPGICPKCARPLDEFSVSCLFATDGEVRRAELVLDLLGSDLSINGKGTRRGLSDFLADSIQFNANGNSASFARMLHVGKSTLHGWLHGDHVPDFEMIIVIAQGHTCSIEEVLCGRSNAAERSFWVPRRSPSSKAATPVSQPKDPMGLLGRLEEMLAIEPPLSMREVALRLEVAGKTIRKFHPDICKAISARWMSSKIANSDKRRSTLAIRIRELARTMAAEGINPTFNRLRVSCPQAEGLVGARKFIQGICQEVRIEFGVYGSRRKAFR